MGLAGRCLLIKADLHREAGFPRSVTSFIETEGLAMMAKTWDIPAGITSARNYSRFQINFMSLMSCLRCIIAWSWLSWF